MSLSNEILLPEILLYGQYHDKYNKISMVDKINSIIYLFQRIPQFYDILTSLSGPTTELIKIFKITGDVTDIIKKINNTMLPVQIEKLLKGGNVILLNETDNSFIIKNGSKFISSKGEDIYESTDLTYIMRFYTKNNKNNITKLNTGYQYEDIYKYLIDDMGGCDINLFEFVCIFYQAQNDLLNLKNGICKPNGIVLEILLDRIRTFTRLYHSYTNKIKELKDLWFDVNKQYYTNSNFDIPSSTYIKNDSIDSDATTLIRFNNPVTFSSLDKRLKEINDLSDEINELSGKECIDKIIKLIQIGSQLLNDHTENNINYWMILTRIVRLPLKLYNMIIEYDSFADLLSLDSLKLLCLNFGNWIEAVSSSTLVHVYKYAYYLLIYKALRMHKLIPDIEQSSQNLLNEFISDCNKTQIYGTFMLFDIELIKSTITITNPVWFSNVDEYKVLLKVLNNLIKSENSVADNQLVNSKIMFSQMFASNIECFINGEQRIANVNCSDDLISRGYVISTFNETDSDTGEVLVKRDVRFSEKAISLNKNFVVADELCATYYFPNIMDLFGVSSTHMSILLQMICTCRLENLHYNNYPINFPGKCTLKPTKNDYNLTQEIITYTADIQIFERNPVDHVCTNMNISGINTDKENHDSIYNFIKFLQTNDPEYLKYMFGFMKLGHSLGLTDHMHHEFTDLLKYSNNQITSLSENNLFSHKSLFVRDNLLENLYKVFDNNVVIGKENLIKAIKDKLQNLSFDKLLYNIFVFVSLYLIDDSLELIKLIIPEKIIPIEELRKKQATVISDHNRFCCVSNAIKYYVTLKNKDKTNEYMKYLNEIIDKKHDTFIFSKPKLSKSLQDCRINEKVHYLSFPLPELKADVDVIKKPTISSSKGKSNKKTSKKVKNFIKPDRYRYGDLVNYILTNIKPERGKAHRYIAEKGLSGETRYFTDNLKRVFDITNEISDQNIENDSKNNTRTSMSYNSVFMTQANKLLDMDKYDPSINTLANVGIQSVEEDDEEDITEEQSGGAGEEKKNSGNWRGSTSSNTGSWGRQITNPPSNSSWKSNISNPSSTQDELIRKIDIVTDENGNNIGIDISQIRDILQKISFDEIINDYINIKKAKGAVNEPVVKANFKKFLDFCVSDETEKTFPLNTKKNYLFSLQLKMKQIIHNNSRSIVPQTTNRMDVASNIQTPSANTSSNLVFNERIAGLVRLLDPGAFERELDDIKNEHKKIVGIPNLETISDKEIDDHLRTVHNWYYNKNDTSKLNFGEYDKYIKTLVSFIEGKLKTQALGWNTMMAKSNMMMYYYPKTKLTKPIKILENPFFSEESIQRMLNNNQLLLENISIDENEYINDFHEIRHKLFGETNIQMKVQQFDGKHNQICSIYSYEHDTNVENTVDIKLSNLFMSQLGLFLQNNNIVWHIYEIDGYKFDDTVKQYVKKYTNYESILKNILLTQNVIDNKTQFLVKNKYVYGKLDDNEILSLVKQTHNDAYLDNNTGDISIYLPTETNQFASKLLTNVSTMKGKEHVVEDISNELGNVQVYRYKLELPNGNIKYIIRSVTINGWRYDNFDSFTDYMKIFMEKYILGYVNDKFDVEIFTPLTNDCNHFINAYTWYDGIGKTSIYPYYELEIKGNTIYKRETQEKSISLVQMLLNKENSHFIKLIETLMYVASSTDDILIWEKKGSITSIDIVKSHVNFKFLADGKVVINNEYEIIKDSNWILQKWVANTPNLLMVNDKHNNYFIYVMPIGQNPIKNELSESSIKECKSNNLNVILGREQPIIQIKQPKKQETVSEDIIKTTFKSYFRNFESNLPKIAQAVKIQNSLVYDNETIENHLNEVYLGIVAPSDEDENELTDETEINMYKIYMYNYILSQIKTSSTTSIEVKQSSEYLLLDNVLQNILNRMDSVKFAAMFKDQFDNIDRYTTEIAKSHFARITGNLKSTSVDIDNCVTQIETLVKYYRQLLEDDTESPIDISTYITLEQSIYIYVKTNFGLTSGSEKLIKFNNITNMPIITNKQILEQLCLSYLNFNEIGNIFELSNIIRKMDVKLDKYVITALSTFIDYKKLNETSYIENERFRIPSFARVQSKLLKQVYNIDKHYNVKYNLIDGIDHRLEHDTIIYKYYFPDGNDYITPTFAEYFVYSLLDSKQRDLTFTVLYNKMKELYTSYTDDVKEEFKKIDDDVMNTKQLTINPLEFFYQCIAGFFARSNQKQLVDDIIEDISDNIVLTQTGGYKTFSGLVDANLQYQSKANKIGRIHTLIMGGGKTKMITPLVILKYLQQISLYYLKQQLSRQDTERKGNHIYLILPENLVTQSYEHLSIMNLYFPIIVSKLEEMRDSHANFSNSVKNRNELELQLYIMSDTTMKCGILNDVNGIIQNNCMRHCYLFDEVDTVLDPIISELNYPKKETETGLKNIDNFFDVVFNILCDIYKNPVQEIKTLLSNHLAQFPTTPQFLTTPHFYLRTKSTLLSDLQTYAKNKCIEQFKSYPKIIQGLSDPYADKSYLDSLTDDEISIVMSLNNFILEALPVILSLRNRHHYGLSDKIPNKQKVALPTIVPFSHAEKPRDGSNFSNPILVMGLTIVDYLIQLKPLPNQIVNDMITHIKNIQSKYPVYYREFSNIYTEYSSLNISISLENLNNVLDLSSKDVKILRKNNLFIKLICQHNCSKYIKFSLLQDNISGLDLIMSNTASHRSGFTGTPNIPSFVDFYTDQSLVVADEAVDLTGKTTQNKINDTILRSEIQIIENSDNVIEYLKQILQNNLNHTVLIDVGAVLVGTNASMIFDLVKLLKPDLQQFIYWNDYDSPIAKSNDGKELNWTGALTSDPSNMFYYYDHRHTTGIDAFIDKFAKGLVLLGVTSRYRDVAQGMYRMRKLHAGQTITFIINKSIKSNIDQNGLLEWFNIDEQSYLISQQELMNNQNVLALSRYNEIRGEKQTSFEINNAFTYPTHDILTTMDLLTTKTSLRHKKILDIKQNLDNSLRELTDVNINKQKILDLKLDSRQSQESISMAIQQEIEQIINLTQEQEQAQERTLRIIPIVDQLISNNIVADYFNSENIIYYKQIIEGIVYISKNLEYYLSPYMILYTNEIFFILPFIEGYKLLDTYNYNKNLFPNDIFFIDSNGIHHNKGTENDEINTVKVLTVFLVKSIVEYAYVSLNDYMNLFTAIKSRSKLDITTILPHIININSTDNIFKLFSIAITIYSQNQITCDEQIKLFNSAKTIEERKQIYDTINEEIKPVFFFLTLDGKIVDRRIDF
jgi:hypothetical protein